MAEARASYYRPTLRRDILRHYTEKSRLLEANPTETGHVRRSATNQRKRSARTIPYYESILNDFAEVFQEDLRQRRTNLAQHTIRLKEKRAFKIRRYQYLAANKQTISRSRKNTNRRNNPQKPLRFLVTGGDRD